MKRQTFVIANSILGCWCWADSLDIDLLPLSFLYKEIHTCVLDLWRWYHRYESFFISHTSNGYKLSSHIPLPTQNTTFESCSSPVSSVSSFTFKLCYVQNTVRNMQSQKTSVLFLRRNLVMRSWVKMIIPQVMRPWQVKLMLDFNGKTNINPPLLLCSL